METEKTCKNCAWFTQHYFKWKSRLLKTPFGHCSKSKEKYFEEIPCKKWKQAEADTSDGKEYLCRVLNKLLRDIHDLVLILKLDEELKN